MKEIICYFINGYISSTRIYTPPIEDTDYILLLKLPYLKLIYYEL